MVSVARFLKQQWFLTALAMVLAAGILAGPRWASLVDSRFMRYGVVAIVLFLMALPLEAATIARVLRRPGPALLATGVNFGLLPLAAWGFAQGLGEEMRMGLFVAAATPCTLASAAVWTRRAGGDDSIALMTTVITNLTCFVVTPTWLLITSGQVVENESLRFSAMVVKLGLLVVLPMVLAQLLRRCSSAIAARATRQKTFLSMLAQCGILTMVLMGAVQTGIRLQGPHSADFGGQVLLMIALVATLHTAMFGLGMLLARRLGMSRGEEIAVGVAGSQKTLMVGLQMALDLGYSILPMVTYHVGQLLIDTVITDRIRKKDAAGDA